MVTVLTEAFLDGEWVWLVVDGCEGIWCFALIYLVDQQR